MKSQMSKDFSLKSKLRGLADGGSVGSTASLLGRRGRQIDDVVDGASTGEAPRPAAPAPQPTPAPRKGILRTLANAVGFVDGGHVAGPGGPTDDEVGPVMLSDEEYVLPADTVKAVGKHNLDALRAATHTFKDKSKGSALRGEIPGKANGGLAGDEFTRSINSTAPPQPQPTIRPAVNTGAMNEYLAAKEAAGPAARAVPPPASAPGFAARTAGGALRGVGNFVKAGLPFAGLAGAGMALHENLGAGRDQRNADLGADSPLGNVAADAASALANVGNAATFGLAGKLGQGLSNVVNGSPFFDEDKPVAAAAPAARPAAIPGVPALPDNATPAQAQSFLRTGGTAEPQNLGKYGGSSDVFGSATDPNNPTRINSFAGANTGPAPAGRALTQDELAFSGINAGDRIQSVLRNQQQLAQEGAGRRIDPASAINDHYDDMARQLAGKFGARGQGNLAKHMVDLNQQRAAELNNLNSNETSRLNNQATNETARYGDDLRQRSAGQTRDLELAKFGLEQGKYAREQANEAQDKGFKRFTETTGDMFNVPDGKGGFTKDTQAQERFRDFILNSDPKMKSPNDPTTLTGFMSMKPQEQQALQAKFKIYDQMNQARNAAAGKGMLNSGGITNTFDPAMASGEATFNDVFNNNLAPTDYLRAKLSPFTANQVVRTRSGQSVLRSDLTSTGGSRDLDKERMIKEQLGE